MRDFVGLSIGRPDVFPAQLGPKARFDRQKGSKALRFG